MVPNTPPTSVPINPPHAVPRIGKADPIEAPINPPTRAPPIPPKLIQNEYKTLYKLKSISRRLSYR